MQKSWALAYSRIRGTHIYTRWKFDDEEVIYESAGKESKKAKKKNKLIK